MCSTSLVIREIIIKNTMKCHSILTRWGKIKNTGNNKFGQECEKLVNSDKY